MMTFWILAAALTILALCFVLPPLWRRRGHAAPTRTALNASLYEQKLKELEDDLRQGTLAPEQYEQGKHDLESSLFEDLAGETPETPAPPRRRWATAAALGVIVPVAAFGLYRFLGAGADLSAPSHASAPLSMTSPHPGVKAAAPGAKADSLQVATERLAKRLQAKPDDPEGWLLLARSYQFLKRYAEADKAVAQAIALGKNDAATMTLQQTVHALAAGGVKDGAPAVATTGAADTIPKATVQPVAMRAAAALAGPAPSDAAGWVDRAHAYQAQHRYLDAADAYAKATAQVKDNAGLWADYADALAAANGKQISGQAEKLVEKALAIDPNHPKALWLAATAALQRGDKTTALKHWQHLKKLLPPDSADARVIAANIAEVQDQPAAAAATGEPTADASGATIHGVVSIAPALAKDLKAGDTLFIFAKASNGPPMPLAVLRKKAGELPVKFELDDSMAMTPMAKLSNYGEVVVGARVSKNGSAMPSSGDLEGSSGVVKVGDDHIIHIVINHRV
jgi:cytochrome c-type biogenesis protein CcmI